jgi:hypothetical protein
MTISFSRLRSVLIREQGVLGMKKILLFGILTSSLNAHAGFGVTTAASRANCMNNESITWNSAKSFNWKTISIHQHVNGNKDPYWNHLVDTGWEVTWRSAAVHWGESPDVGQYKWNVNGYHFFADYANGKWPFAENYARDCHLYDGWWDI